MDAETLRRGVESYTNEWVYGGADYNTKKKKKFLT